jgi:FG-GAP repeat
MNTTKTRTLSPFAVATLILTASTTSVQSADIFPDVIELSSLNGINGFVLNGIDAADESGSSVSSAGDVNGDGFDDLIINALFADPNGNINAGESYVVFGGVGVGSSGVIGLSSLNGTNGFVLNGIDAGDESGSSVSSAGDVNGDGFDDLVIGVFKANSSAGESYVVFGGSSVGSGGVIELSSLNGSNGFVLNGIDASDRSGRSVSCAGDINGDGIDDLIIGAFRADPNGNNDAGESYVVFGGVGVGSSGVIGLSSLNGTNGFVLNGIDAGDWSGSSVSSAGDVNGDGFDDLIIGASRAGPNGNSQAGESYVVFGGVGSSAVIELSSLNGTNGFVINGIDAGDQSGSSVSSAGDVNGDGYNDLIISASIAAPNGTAGAGENYVVFGGLGVGSSGVIELSSLIGFFNGFVINGIDEGDFSGSSVSSAGDVNGDGFDDLIIGAPNADPYGNSEAGESYVVFGGLGVGSSGVIELSFLNNFYDGILINGNNAGDLSGSSVSSAGDVNGDGLDDLIIGAKGADPNGNSQAGESYVVFGRYINAWTRSGGGAFEAVNNWATGLIPAGGSVSIEPEFGGTVTLSQSNDLLFTILALGSERGVTTLDIGPSSLLGVSEPLGLPASAAINGSGILVADAGIMNSGKLGGDGLFVIADAGITNNGEIASKQLLIVSDVSNNELIDLDGNNDGPKGRAVLDVDGTLSNESTGVIQMRRAVTELSVSSGLINAGQVSIAFSEANVIGDVINLGTPDGMGGFTPLGSIAISGNSSALFTDDMTNQSTVVLTSDSELVILGSLSGNGISGPGGPGSAGMVFVEDGINPGFSPGIARFDGDLILGLNSTTKFEIAGNTAGAGHDQIIVAGTVDLSGSASIELINNFVPSPGDTFQLLEFGSIIGGFSSLSIDEQLLALNVDTSNLLIDGTISIPAYCPADLNGDGALNFFDVSAFLGAYTAMLPSADFTGDGMFNFIDVSAFLGAYSAGCP